ncbi:UdgX family uracil-DNA binding protein [Pyxidicoccus parkwayensis]|uniref:Type-4 uracil-DNA glycosylase n=1 Tax=Pyxidicoccus parkwayensis TaxID=2813578 RepID=A0ABX7P5S3_9BACT|nr:UdgX family uracil-DNA binding protein [Pyxidicoccus parkwaysis]QSQ25770.1 UdgX family uracil-DNA binding protein [Pyxidicoccus parkwaysis]
MRVSVEPDLASFRAVARGLLARGAPPERVLFEEASAARGELPPLEAPVTELGLSQPVLAVPRDFLGLAEKVACHRDPEKWALLYRVLWRLTHGERGLLSLARDADVHRLRMMERAVRRDAHAMTAFVRFRRVRREGMEHFIAWHRPDHLIVRHVAPFFVRRFPSLRWSIFTPDACVHWDLKRLTFETGVPRSEAPVEDPLESLSGVVSASRAPLSEQRELSELAEAVRACKVCPLHVHATHGVVGEGPVGAPLMLVGEQPGDLEDREGRPFVGPVGRLLEEVLGRAGLKRSELYVTNAVKHSGWAEGEGGKRRPHPSRTEVLACRGWLEAEVAAVRPKLIVALGATAAQVFLGPGFRIHLSRGQVFETPWAEGWMATFHPSALLRMSDPRKRAEARIHFEADLRSAVEWLRRSGGPRTR